MNHIITDDINSSNVVDCVKHLSTVTYHLVQVVLVTDILLVSKVPHKFA